MHQGTVFLAIWVAWIVSWVAVVFWSAQIEDRVARNDAWLYRAVIGAGLVLFFLSVAGLLPMRQAWHIGQPGAAALVVMTFGALAFTWWARLHIGQLWSGAITLKSGHHIVDTGPYALVRHPIYAGFLAATVTTALAQPTAATLAGCVLMIAGTWQKARMEERFLVLRLGPQAYATYRRQVPMLVPFLPAGVG